MAIYRHPSHARLNHMIISGVISRSQTVTASYSQSDRQTNRDSVLIDYDSISDLYKFQIDISSNNREIKYRNMGIGFIHVIK